MYAMDSLDEECTPLKKKYDECFNGWFRNSFLKGKADRSHDQVCGELFKSYQSCLQVTKLCVVSNLLSTIGLRITEGIRETQDTP